MSVLTPNMNLIQSTVGTDSGLSWEQNLNASLSILDGHNHSAGSGLQINPSGIYINSTLSFNSNPASSLAYVNLTAQGGSVPTPIDLSLYASGGELFYLDGSGNAVQITKTGNVNATSSGISSGSATASFVSSVLVVDQSAGVGAAIDAATYVLRYNGSYPSPAGNYIALQAPAALSAPFALTFPASTPASSHAFVTSDTSGNLSYTNVDNTTLTITANVASVGTIQTANIAALAVTPAKLSAPTYAASSVLTLATQTGGLTAVGTLQVTLTTHGRPVFICLQPGTTNQAAVLIATDSTGTTTNANVAIYRDSSFLVGPFTAELQGPAAGPGVVGVPVSSVQYIDLTATAGSHTYQIYLGLGGGGAGAVAELQNCFLLAYEL